VTRVECDAAGQVDPDLIQRAITPKTKLVAILHASNVTGAIQPVAEVGKIARDHGAALLVDAAQTLGHLPISVDDLLVDMLAAPGHKGLLGPLGTGVLYIRHGIESRLRSVRQGGTGTRSEEDCQPQSMPDKYESGNANVPGLAGLAAGVEFIEARGLLAIRRHELALTERLLDRLSSAPQIQVFGPTQLAERVGVVSVRVEGYDPQEVAAVLDATQGIQVRSGLHCAPLIHRAMGTFAGGGTVRFSFSPANTLEEIEIAASALVEIATAAPSRSHETARS
jgi:selenocysteine lyase/cysteine desulfurase